MLIYRYPSCVFSHNHKDTIFHVLRMFGIRIISDVAVLVIVHTDEVDEPIRFIITLQSLFTKTSLTARCSFLEEL